MSKHEKILLKVLREASDANHAFEEPCLLLRHFGFDGRVRGDHHIFSKDGIEEILNLQPKRREPYQVKQVRQLILRYKLGEVDDE